jgi:cytochrome c-type biogenesis protein CcmE
VSAQPVVVPAPAQSWRKLLIVGVVVLLAVLYLVYTATQSGAVYYLTVGELRASGPLTRPVRVSGNVVDGSVQRDGATVRFAVADEAGQLPVVYRGVVPDIFGPEVQVVVEGRYGADGVFQAQQLLAKCPSKFAAAGPPEGA